MSVIDSIQRKGKAMTYTLLCVYDGEIFKTGPLLNRVEALKIAKQMQLDGEFDVRDQFVYLFDGEELEELKWKDISS